MVNFLMRRKFIISKHRFKRFIKDVVLGSIERNELIIEELQNKLGDDFNFKNLDKVFQIILTVHVRISL